jgi:hypothetical protein
MHYGKIGTMTLPITGIVVAHNILIAITMITVGVVLWQIVPRIRRNRSQG